MKYGRKRGRTAKRTHIEIIVVGDKKQAAKTVKRTETKKIEKKAEQTTAEKKNVNEKISGSEQKITTEAKTDDKK